MIRKVVIASASSGSTTSSSSFPGHVVLAGPNNTGKTTLLQAIAAWDLALEPLAGAQRLPSDTAARYTKGADRAPGVLGRAAARVRSALARSATTVRRADRDRGPERRRLDARDGVRRRQHRADLRPPRSDVEPGDVRDDARARRGLRAADDRPEHRRAGLYQRRSSISSSGRRSPARCSAICSSRRTPPERGLGALQDAIRSRLFGYELLPPTPRGAHILAEYQASPVGPRLDIASAGSGFQQVLMLLAISTRGRAPCCCSTSPTPTCT